MNQINQEIKKIALLLKQKLSPEQRGQLSQELIFLLEKRAQKANQ